jgi:metallophosphoesterase (TIGR00282 family)
LAWALFQSGVDVITMGNHTFHKNDIFELFEKDVNMIRPINMSPRVPGSGSILMEVGSITVGVINAMGRIYMEPCDCPFRAVSREIEQMQRRTNIIVVDFHAEATSEKLAMGYYLDGRVSAVVGTHTHVPTADEKILPKGTAYITDVGMTGPSQGILGMKKDIIIERFLTSLPQRFKLEEGACNMDSVMIEVDEFSGKAQSIKRFRIEE